VKEIQINSTGPLEVSYYANSAEGISLALEHNLALNEECEMISKSANGEVVIVMTGKPDARHEDYYAIKYSDLRAVKKLYSNQFWRFPNIQLPKGARLANQFGIGYYPGLIGTDEEKYDMYFFCDTQREAEGHFEMAIGPTYKEELHHYKLELGLYGVTYTKDQKVLNLKRYLYPLDPYCKNIEFI